MFCSKRGSQLPENAQFCSTCGASLQQDFAPYPSYLIGNILVTLFFCLPIGAGGIIASTRTICANANRDAYAAQRSSSTARIYMFAGIVCGVIAVLAYGAYVASL